jgi:N-6 DNA Methylase
MALSTLPSDQRKFLSRTVVAARREAEAGAREALKALAVDHHEPFGHMDAEARRLRNSLRAHGRQLGDALDLKRGAQEIERLAHEVAFEHWHRMLFARFLAENGLLIQPSSGVAVTLEECRELGLDQGKNPWELAASYAQDSLPQIFRHDDPALKVVLPADRRTAIEKLVTKLPAEVFVASDALGWVYQFWQEEKKDEVNAAGNKIGAEELPSVTQLFTEDYMVDFLLDNTLGAWHAGKVLAANPKLAENAQSEDELRSAISLPGCPWKYLRFIKHDEGKWTPAAGTFDGWPTSAKELTCLDPCMGSGHFVVAMFERVLALRVSEERLDETAAVAAVIRDNLFGLEIDPRCTQIAAFNLALAAWRRVGHCKLPAMNLACSGLAPNTREADWVAIAGSDLKLRNGMERLYRLFKDAPVLGSLINPRAGEGNLLEAAFHELQPLLEKALAQETRDDSAHEMAVTARGLAKAAEILAGQFTLVATNVPYLGRGKQDEMLMDYCERVHPEAKADLATCFVERSHEFCGSCGSVALVTPQNLLSQLGYKNFRNALLKTKTWNCVARLGPGAFETIGGEVVNVALYCASSKMPQRDQTFLGIDVTVKQLTAKRHELALGQLLSVSQAAQLQNPDARIIFDAQIGIDPLSKIAVSVEGLSTGDSERFLQMFWALPRASDEWDFFQRSPDSGDLYGGARSVLRWEQGNGPLAKSSEARIQGHGAWERRGVVVNLMNDLNTCLSLGAKHDKITAVIVPKKESDLLAIWTFCSTKEFCVEVRKLNPALQPGTGTLVKTPFDLAHWQKVAAEKYPHGLPKPFSSDPTQWLFNGHPAGADQPLHVAVARLLGYQWPRQTGSSFPDCPALGPDGLETLADDDGIVPINAVRGEPAADERLVALLRDAYKSAGIAFDHSMIGKLIAESGSKCSSLGEWLLTDFFDQHCKLFHHRPFVWHIWDGRKDGFNVLVNYHLLSAAGDGGRQLLEKLTYDYLKDWIDRQHAGVKNGDAGAEARLAAAVKLQNELVKIIAGEAPYDIFVRWKPMSEQAVGWHPDINDGVRMNIRPFLLAEDVGKKGAGILRVKPNIKWDKDRGKEPERPKKDFPWFWSCDPEANPAHETDFTGGREFTGERWNEVHYSIAAKQSARALRKGGKS